MRAEQMTLPTTSNPSQFFANMMNSKNERFTRLCLKWGSAKELADDLATIEYDVSERTVSNWRSRNFKRVPYNAVQAVKYLTEKKKLQASQQWSEALREAQSL